MDLKQHLIDRRCNIDLHRPVLDEAENLATFLCWNLAGQMTGYQQYRPFAPKQASNDPRQGRYFTYKTSNPTHCVWGMESFPLRSDILFITEGIFDACRFTERGIPAIAVFGNATNRKEGFQSWLMSLGRFVVSVCDNDKAGLELMALGHTAAFTKDKDLGDSSDEFVTHLIDLFA